MPNLVSFDVDLTAHEGTRLAAVLEALGPDWDPAEVYQGEAEAYRMLYTGLDAGQRAIYHELVVNGVLPRITGRSS
jgi:hypothetical protein